MTCAKKLMRLQWPSQSSGSFIPIQTEAVNYVSQRTELLVSLFYLLTLYLAQRAYRDAGRLRWIAGALATSLLGMGSKEVMLTAPLAVVLYDRAFFSESWAAIWTCRRRLWFYTGLAATAFVSVALIISGARGGTVGFDLGMTWYQYLLAQGTAIPRYVQLMLWPDRLTYDYGQVPFTGSQSIIGLVELVSAGVASIAALQNDRWRPIGFLGAAFFLLLAPSSSFVPIRTEIAAERRVYLAFATIAAIVIVGGMKARPRARGALIVVGAMYFLASGWTASRLAPDQLTLQVGLRLGFAAGAAAAVWSIAFAQNNWVRAAGCALVVAGLMGRTAARSAAYGHPESLWLGSIENIPSNARAYNALAGFRIRARPPQLHEADSLFQRAALLDSMYASPWVGRAAIAVKESRLADAEFFLKHALRLSPGDSAPTDQLGQVLVATGKSDEALGYQKQLADRWPGAETLSRLGVAYLTVGQLDSARTMFTRALRYDTASVDALRYLGATLVELERGAEAMPYLSRSLAAEPHSGLTLGLLALAHAENHQADLAVAAAAAAVAREPNDAVVQMFAGRSMAVLGRLQDAERYLRESSRLSPDDPQALTRLASVLALLGRHNDARASLVRALAIAPGYPAAVQLLGTLRRQ